jgi:hypothetical protein
LKCQTSYLKMSLPRVTRQLEETRVAHLTSVKLLWGNEPVSVDQQFVVGRVKWITQSLDTWLLYDCNVFCHANMFCKIHTLSGE